MQKIHEFMKWRSIEPQVARMTRALIEMDINPMYVFTAVFHEGRDVAELFNELAPMGQPQQQQMGQPQMPATPNPQQMQQMSMLVGNFMKQKTGNAGLDNAMSNLGQQIKLMQQKKPIPTQPTQGTQPVPNQQGQQPQVQQGQGQQPQQ
jgi:hypothetical protein